MLLTAQDYWWHGAVGGDTSPQHLESAGHDARARRSHIPIFLAGRWVESDDLLEVTNPARPGELAGVTYNATDEQYEEAVEAAVKAFEVTRKLPAYERGRDIARDQHRHPGAPRGARPDS